jgi:hypothetical protein
MIIYKWAPLLAHFSLSDLHMKNKSQDDNKFYRVVLDSPKMSVSIYVEVLRMERTMYRRRTRDIKRFLSLLRRELARCPALIHEAHSRNVSQLHMAVKYNCPEVVDYLLSQGTQINCRTINGVTPLHWAAEERSVAMVSLLLNRGACLDAIDRDGKTPLHWAVRAGRIRIARYLVDMGAKTNISDNYKQTPLHVAIRMGLHDMCRLLLEKEEGLCVFHEGIPAGAAAGSGCKTSFRTGLPFGYQSRYPR